MRNFSRRGPAATKRAPPCHDRLRALEPHFFHRAAEALLRSAEIFHTLQKVNRWWHDWLTAAAWGFVQWRRRSPKCTWAVLGCVRSLTT